MASIEELSNEELVARARSGPPAMAERCLGVLYERLYPKVTYWCLRICGDREEAADLAQEVFLRVHQKLDSFRLESRFTTWLYTLTRRVAINRGLANRRRQSKEVEEERVPEPIDRAPEIDDALASAEIIARLKEAINRDLDPMEAQVLCMHYINGMTLPAITRMMEFDNKSGAKAYLVSAKRKLRRRFGRWLEAQSGWGEQAHEE